MWHTPPLYFKRKGFWGGYTHVVSWWTEGRSFAGKGKEKTFFFFQEIKRFNNTRLFRMKEVHTSEEAYNNLFLSPICMHIHYTALIKSVFLHPNIHHQSEQPTDPVTLKYMGDTIRQKYFLYILLILRPFSGFSCF